MAGIKITGNAKIDTATAEIALSLRARSRTMTESDIYRMAERLRNDIMAGTRNLDEFNRFGTAPGYPQPMADEPDPFGPEAYKTHQPGCICPDCEADPKPPLDGIKLTPREVVQLETALEGPAEPQPQAVAYPEVVDRDGDRWELDAATGVYRTHGCLPASLDELARLYSPLYVPMPGK